MFYNSSYAALHAQSWDSLPRPLRYDDLMRAAIRNGPPIDDEETELARRVAAHERGGVQHFERLYPGNRWMRVSRCRSDDGYVAGLALDIGELKAREAATAASEARYRALVDTASVGIWHLDEGGRTLFANDRLATLFGGVAPASIAHAGIQGTESGETSPFGFPAGTESRAVIPAGLGRPETAVLVAASGWVPHQGTDPADGTRHRAAVLTLIDVSALDAALARAEHLAWHDVLTGLPNRAAFDRALAALPDEGGAVLMLLDLDEFKAINDRHGHAAGDAVLREVAIRMRIAIRGTDLVCRLGGDEFAVLLRGAGAADHLADTAARLSQALRQPVLADGIALPMSASIGSARYPTDVATGDELLRAADLALYQVKHEGRGGVALYQPAMSVTLERRLLLREALGGAVARNEFQLAWQAQVMAAGKALRGAEALLRWPGSPLGENISPAEFLSAAAEAGLMPAIDAWVLDAALRQMREWAGQPGAPPIATINISATSLRDRSFPARVADALLRHQLSASVLEIEIPEDIAARDLDHVEEVLNGLRSIGVSLALDDFGGGLSSVAHLVRLPVDIVKLDRSIVAGLPGGTRERAVLRAVAGITRSMNIPLLAEGVESEEQIFALRREGCEIMQGFLYGRPISPAELVPHYVPLAAAAVSRAD
ncbi:MAG: EAL domain-containing protein [Pseudomonadota bacterium]|nr:EAL domain-containing protein [Pseudomonadota bacterium]